MRIALLGGSTTVPFSLDLDNTGAVSILCIRSTGPASVEAQFALASRIEVPLALLDGTRLKTMQEIRKEANTLSQEVEAQWHAIVSAVSGARFNIGGDRKFLKAIAFPVSATTISGTVSLNLGACLMNSAITLDARVELAAACDINHDGVGVKASMAWRLTVNAAVPQLSLRLPLAGMSFPHMAFPDFSWPDLALPDTLPDFDVDLPTLPGIPIKLTHGKPSFGPVNYVAATGALAFAITVPDAVLVVFEKTCKLGNPQLAYADGTASLTNFSVELKTMTWAAMQPAPLPAPLAGLSLLLEEGSLRLVLEPEADRMEFKGVLTQRVTIFPTDQPSRSLTLDLQLPFQGDQLQSSIKISTDAKPIEREVKLKGASQLLASFLDNLAMPGSVCLNLSLPNLPAAELEALLDVLSALLGAIARGLAGLGRIVEQGLRALLSLLRKAADSVARMQIILVLDDRTGQLQQILLRLQRTSRASETIYDTSALTLTAPSAVELALLIDLRDGERNAYLVATVDGPQDQNNSLRLESDLWFASESQESAASNATPPASGTEVVPSKLIEITVAPNAAGRFSFVPFGIRHDDVVFFHSLATALPPFQDHPDFAFGGYQLVELGSALTVTAKFNLAGAKERFLPFLAAPSGESPGGGLGDTLKQYIKITKVGTPTFADGKVVADADVTIMALGSEIASELKLELDLHRMSVAVTGGEIKLSLPANKPFDLFGMQVTFLNKDGSPLPEAENREQMVLDMRTADTRMYLNEELKMVLDFASLGTDEKGNPLRFDVTKLVVHGGGLDLDARLAGPAVIRINGLETDFTFESAAISVRDGTVQAFSLRAMGKLPPALLGDVDVRLQLDFGQRKDGSFGLLNGGIELKTKGKPIRSEQTHFVLTLEALSVRVFEDGGSLHFCAFITGGAMFKPEEPSLADGMLKKLSGVELKFTDCPICGASDVIRRELEKLNLSFVVALDEPVKANLFELFTFELRSIGFEPMCNMFEGRPAALVLGGQVSFAASGDLMRAECDFHKLYIAPPAEGSYVPRIRCEGLGLALRLNGILDVEGKVVAVDGRMPESVLQSVSEVPPLKGKGFMGQGRIAIKGLPPFAASFGFVELELANGELKRAWFVYLEASRLSYYFQMGPVPLYLREAGLGLGYHFTFVGIEAIDKATSLPAMITAMDKIAATALEPAKIDSWIASEQGDLTLVARIMISMSSASSPAEPLVYRASEEKDLPNVLLLNAVAAMRKSTFLLTSTVWLGYSYYDWDHGRHIGANDMVGKHTMSGYVILAGARSEFLARLKSNPGAEIGPRLPMPQQFKDALKEIEFEATFYIRPGLLHFELGWPDRIRWSKNIAGLNVSVVGGAIFRVHEWAILAGLNLEGKVTFAMSARLDAGVVGVAVSASVYAALTARIIGFLDSQNVGNSLYYSLFSLQVNVKFEVSAWLEIDAWLCKITIHISFALSLQIDVMSEIALQGDLAMGARVRASIAISIFGRSLGLSVGLGFNPGLVDNAANRVGRFMNMGLMQEVPSVTPDFASQDAANDAATERGQERREARAVAGAASKPEGRPDNVAQVPHEDPLPAAFVKKGRAANLIGPSDFQVIFTYPKAPPRAMAGTIDPEQWVYLTFLPLDAAPGSGEENQARSSFYAAPWPGAVPGAGPDHTMVFPAFAAEAAYADYYTCALDGTQWKWQPRQFAPGQAGLQVATIVQWNVALPYSQSTEKSSTGVPADSAGDARLDQLFFAAFRTLAANARAVDATHPYMEPNARPPIQAEGTVVGRTPRDNGARHDRQERAYNKNLAQDPADRRCHEARDFLMQKFVSDLFQMADDGIVTETAHVVHVGLTILVKRTLAEKLGLAGDLPFVQKRTDADPLAASDPCRVFNPPHLTFQAKPPRFDKVACRFEDDKALLDWDLVWDHAVEPEHFLQHYQLKRWIESGGEPSGEARTLTFKRAHGVSESADGKRRVVERGAWQFTDEFEDMSAIDKARLFDPSQDLLLRYSVIPVCVSGTWSAPCSDFILARSGMPQLTPVRQAAAVMVIDPREHKKGQRVAALDLKLRLASGNDTIGAADRREWQLVLRRETIIPSGQYGSDAQTQRALGTAVRAERTLRRGDQVFAIPAGGDTDFPAANAQVKDKDSVQYASVAQLLPALLEALQDAGDPHAYTLFVRTAVIRGTGGDAKLVASSALVAVELGVEIARANANAQAVFARVEALELVRLPFGTEKMLLDPVSRVDMATRSGRASVREPASADVRQPASLLAVHPDFGGVTKLLWNLRPHALSGDAVNKYRLLAGFDVIGLDLDGLATAGNADDWQSGQSWRAASVRLQSPETVRLTPAEVGEPSNWKVRYPSQLARRRAGGAWYSPAESQIAWPAPEIRREPIPEPSSELIKALLREGAPDAIVLRMTGSDKLDWRFELDPAKGGGWSLVDGATLRFKALGKGPRTPAAALREALRALRAVVVEPPAAYTLDFKRNWALSLLPVFETTDEDNKKVVQELVPELLPMFFERDAHPLLEAIAARMRRLPPSATRVAARLADLDRRPAPIVNADTVSGFLSLTGEAADPFGWAILDRLGLGITVRLFDPVDDDFVAPGELHAKLLAAIKEIDDGGLYTAARKHLFVEVLLQPGTLMQPAEFTSVPGIDGVIGRMSDADVLESDGLAMIRLSLRPLISQEVGYKVWRGSANSVEPLLDSLLAQTDCVVPLSGHKADLAAISLGAFLRCLDKHLAPANPAPPALTHTVILRGPQVNLFGQSDTAPGGSAPDAFGRFAPWQHWALPAKAHIDNFHVTLRNALGLLAADPSTGEVDEITEKWDAWNLRFFTYCADPALPAAPQYAFAAVEASDQVSCAADTAGQLSVNIPETDGYAHQRAFAVLPQWRYAQMLADAGYTELAALLNDKREKGIVGARRYAISTVLRTAPIQPCEAVALSRLGDAVWWRKDLVHERQTEARNAKVLLNEGFSRLGTDPGNALPIALRHHAELRPSKSSLIPARALSLAGSLTTFILTPADSAWCDAFLGPDHGEQLHRMHAAVPAIDDSATLDGVARLLEEPPVDARIRVAGYLPHWYRHIVVVSAGAGSSVAEPVSAYLAEAPSRLLEVSDGAAPAPKRGHPWQGFYDGQVDLEMSVQPMGTAKQPRFGIAVPALRYRDTTDATTARIWSGDIANLADPEVAYAVELEVAATDMRTRTIVTPLARITRAAASGLPLVPFLAFPLSPDWQVLCDFALGTGSDPRHELRCSITPMGVPVRIDQSIRHTPDENLDEALTKLRALLAPGGYLRGDVLRVPGGWSASWLDHFGAVLAAADPAGALPHVSLLWRALAAAGAGLPRAGFAGLAMFPLFGVQTITLRKPATGDSALADALVAWKGQLAQDPGALAGILGRWLEAPLAAIAQGNWPFAQDEHVAALPWIDTIPVPGAPCACAWWQEPRMLLPELLTDDQYKEAVADVDAQAGKELLTRLAALYQEQRSRALAGGALRIRATRSDAIPLELPLLSLTK